LNLKREKSEESHPRARTASQEYRWQSDLATAKARPGVSDPEAHYVAV